MLITKEQQEALEKILIDFLCFLNKNGYINDYDFDYEKHIKKFIKQIKTNKMEKTLKNNETAQFGIGAVSTSKFSAKKIAEIKEEVIRCNRSRTDLYLYGYLNEKENKKINDKIKKLADKYHIW